MIQEKLLLFYILYVVSRIISKGLCSSLAAKYHDVEVDCQLAAASRDGASASNLETVNVPVHCSVTATH